MATTKLGFRAQLFHVGAAVVRKAKTRPLPKLRSTTNGVAVAQVGRHPNLGIVRRPPAVADRDIAFHPHRLQKRVLPGGEHSEDEMPVDLHVGSGFEAIDRQLPLAGQRRGEYALAVAIQNFVEKLDVRAIAEEKGRAAARGHVFLQRLDRRRIEPFDVAQANGLKIGQRFDAQITRRFDLRPDAGPSRAPGDRAKLK